MTRLLKSVSFALALGVAANAAAQTIFVDPTLDQTVQANLEASFQAATGPLTTIDFEDQPNGAVLTGNEYAGLGALFSQPDGGGIRLLDQNIVNFVPNSGVNALFPFDAAPSERLQLELTDPQLAVGLWLIDSEGRSQLEPESLDFYDANDNLIASVVYPISDQFSNPNPIANFFVGVISDTAPIARVVLNEYENDQLSDGTPFQEDVGFDDVQFGVPEPSSLTLLALAGLGLIRRR